MKIQGMDPLQGGYPLNGPDKNRGTPDGREASGQPAADVVKVSAQSAEMARYLKIADEIPEVRIDRVERLSELIRLDQYQIQPDQVAESILKGNLFNTEM